MEIEQLYECFVRCKQVSTDSRNCPKDSLFFAMRGANFNGNAYVSKAFEQGCAMAVIDDKNYLTDERCILVGDCLKTLQDLARFHREKLGTPIIGITGTNGKTTTKELVSAVLSQKYNILYTQGNLNNHIGVPLTLLRLTKEHDMAVVEMGANHPGEIKSLVNISKPNYGLITNVGKAHLEGFGSFEGVMKTKGELYEYLRASRGKVFLHADSPYLNKMATDLDTITYGTSDSNYVSGSLIGVTPYLRVQYNTINGSIEINTNLIGDYNLANVMSAVCVGHYFNVSDDKIKIAIESYFPTNNRSQLCKTNDNTLIIDAYNANPTSMDAALQNFAKIDATSKCVVLGDMFELGETSLTEHQNIVHLIEKIGIHDVYLLGKNFSATKNDFKCFENAESFANYLKENPIIGKIILIKGSNSMKMSSLVSYL